MHLLGFVEIRGSTRWSKARRLFSAYLVFLCFALAAEAVLLQQSGWSPLDKAWMAWVLIAFSVTYFSVVVVGVIFLTSERFRPNAIRLARDTLVSVIFCIMSFAVVYRFTGITLADTCASGDMTEAADAIYFSAVTFSTLGYGDFRPCEGGRLLAAAHAIYGNLHLGLIVGSAFFVAQTRGEGPRRPVPRSRQGYRRRKWSKPRS
ncbi:MAG: potassium channel family protein [Pseudomonadota bacterium]